jgi:predicted RNA-binding protein associated with RNAse of E/G family
VTFPGELLETSAAERRIRAPWERGRLDLGYVVFEPGDVFIEYYYTDRWYAIFELRTADGALKGWYCNISYPARFTPDAIHSEDLELDLFVPPDRRSPLRLDIDELEARGVAQSDPAAYAAAYAALDELERMASERVPPFDAS